jgi:hypothetical protein
VPNYDVFLAHAGADMARAKELYQALVPDLSVFLDAVSLLPGDEWDREIPKAQQKSQATVILVSRSVEMAYYLRDEIASAIALHRARPGEHRAVPVFLDGMPKDPMDVPYGLRILNGIDAVTEGGLPGVAHRLKALVANLKGMPPPEPPPAPRGIDASWLYERLVKLLPSQFETFLLFASVPVEHIPTSPAPIAMRAVSVVQLVQQGGPTAANKATEALKKVAPGLV